MGEARKRREQMLIEAGVGDLPVDDIPKLNDASILLGALFVDKRTKLGKAFMQEWHNRCSLVAKFGRALKGRK